MRSEAAEQPASGGVPPPRRFVGRRAAEATSASDAAGSGSIQPVASAPRRVIHQQVPADILQDAALNAAIAVLPSNYSFEVHKTVWRLRNAHARVVALQFPEGLLMYACVLADIFKTFAHISHCIVLGDVAYGACCVDDLSASALGADFLVHYGHSCLVPVDVTTMPCMYIFVDIRFDNAHLLACVRQNFPAGMRITLAGTIQFASAVHSAKAALCAEYPALCVPQAKPLSPGEVLGCTAPSLPDSTEAIVFIADGRFHLEAIMIANPDVPAYRYDPYGRILTRETYDHVGMKAARRAAIEKASRAKSWGVVLGTLGRQGNPHILTHVQARLASRGLPHSVVLLSEISPAKIAALRGPDAWVQIACPRLSIDWGEAFAVPVLTPYEAEVALGALPGWWQAADGETAASEARESCGKERPYPMSYYEQGSGPYNSCYQPQRVKT